jgi:hypothetical protein
MSAVLFDGMHGIAGVADLPGSVDVDAPFYHIGTKGTIGRRPICRCGGILFSGKPRRVDVS